MFYVKQFFRYPLLMRISGCNFRRYWIN